MNEKPTIDTSNTNPNYWENILKQNGLEPIKSSRVESLDKLKATTLNLQENIDSLFALGELDSGVQIEGRKPCQIGNSEEFILYQATKSKK